MTIVLTSGTASYTFPTNPKTWSYSVLPKYSSTATLNGKVVQLLDKTESGSFSGDIATGMMTMEELSASAFMLSSFYAAVLSNQRNDIPTRLQWSDKGIDVDCILGDFRYAKSLATNSIPYAITFQVVRDSTPMTRTDMDALFSKIRDDIGYTAGVDGWHGGSGDATLTQIAGLTPNGMEVSNATVGTSADLASNSPVDVQKYAHQKVLDMGWTESDFQSLIKLWNQESGWNYKATNPSSGAYGICQALPPSKMSSAGADWKTNPKTQVEWGLNYIKQRYGSPSKAWQHELSSNWY